MSAIDIDHVTKVYRRHTRSRQFATLKSALLTGSLARNLRPEESFRALNDISVTIQKARPMASSGATVPARAPC